MSKFHIHWSAVWPFTPQMPKQSLNAVQSTGIQSTQLPKVGGCRREKQAGQGRTGLSALMLVGFVTGVPIPAEHAAGGSRIEKATQQALREADAQSIQGHSITPFLLHRVQQLTGGASLAANIHLIKHNAAIGSQIACSLQVQLQPS